MNPQLLKPVGAVAAALDRSPATVYAWLRTGLITHFERDPHNGRVRVDFLQATLLSQTHPPRAPRRPATVRSSAANRRALP